MLDQAFSAKNLRKIYDDENRRGRNVDREFFPALVDASARVGAKSERIRDVRRDNAGESQEAIKALLAPLYDELSTLRIARNAAIDTAMATVASNIAAKDYRLRLEEATGPSGMKLYPLRRDAESYFVAKQLQKNVAKLYKLQPSNRRSIISQLHDILSTKFRLHIVRTDLTSFYESIDRKILLKEIDNDQLLSLSSKSHIKCILSDYERLSESEIGIPRGVGISAYLSELYMRHIDDKIKQIPGAVYYARYVDDVIAIFAPTAMDDPKKYVTDVARIMATQSLTLNIAKTYTATISPTSIANFDYLGYNFSVSGGVCSLEMTGKKHSRYKERLNRSFIAYERERIHNHKSAARQLVARIKFLTGNTRLINSKNHAYVGIYYSNSHLTKLSKLIALDAYLRHLTSKILSANVQNQLDRLSFVRGFQERPFYRYNTVELSKIVRVWQYEA